MLDLHALEAFVVVVQEGALGPAGRRLSCSASAVSRRLDRAERDAGLALLHRSTRKITLTERGALYLPVAQGLLREERRARLAAAALRDQPLPTRASEAASG